MAAVPAGMKVPLNQSQNQYGGRPSGQKMPADGHPAVSIIDDLWANVDAVTTKESAATRRA